MEGDGGVPTPERGVGVSGAAAALADLGSVMVPPENVVLPESVVLPAIPSETREIIDTAKSQEPEFFEYSSHVGRAQRKLHVGKVEEPESVEKNSKQRKNEEGKKSKEKAAKEMVTFGQLFRYADRLDVLLMVVGTIGAVGLGMALPLLSLLFGQLTDAFGKNVTDTKQVVHAVTQVALRFVWVALGAAAGAYLEMACWMLTGERQAQRIRKMFLSAILRQDISFFDQDVSTGEVIGRMSGDIVLVQEALGEKVGQYIRLMTTFVGGFVIAFIRGWLLALVMLSCLPLLAVCGALMAWVISAAATQGQEAYAKAGNLAEQCIGAIRTVASFAGEARAVQQYNAKLNDAFKVGVKQGIASGLGMGITIFTMFSTYGLALWYGSKLIVDHGYSGGQVMSVLFGVIIGGMSLGQASPNLAAFAAGKAAAYKIFDVIKRIPPIDSSSKDGATPSSCRGEIELRNVHFAYPSRPDVQIFDDFNLKVAPGQTVALVGESGSGKSTVVALVERFYDPSRGTVFLDGIDLRQLRLSWLRQQIGLVSQEPVLFGMNIGQNIAYGKDGATTEEIIAAAKMANAFNFVSALPQGFDTEVGERGVQLSGGQKQRVAIARAILKDPRILLLDEATSALDAESEHVVQEALERVMADRTTLVIAHRLTTIRGATSIAVMHRGVVVETGSHGELVRKVGGAYAQLVHLQDMQTPQQEEAIEEFEGADTDQPRSSLEGSTGREKRDSESSVSSVGRRSADFLAAGAAQRKTMQQQVQEWEGEEAPASSSGGVMTSLPGSLGHFRRRFLWKRKRKADLEAGSAAASKKKVADVPVWRLARMNAPEWYWALVGALAASGQGLVFPFFSILLSSIIKVFYTQDPHKLRHDADFWAGMFVVLAGATLTFITLQFSLFALVGCHLVRRVRSATFAAALRQEISWFDDSANSSGAIGARLSTDAAQVRGMVGDSLALLVQNIATIIAGLVIAFRANWQLTLVVLSVVPLLGLAGYMQVKTLKGFSANAKVMYEDASKVANDAVSSIRTVASFCAESKVMSLYDEKCQMPLQAGMRRAQVSGLGLGFGNFCIFSVYALAFWYGGKLVSSGKASFKEVFNVFFAVVMSAMGVSQSMGMAPDMTNVQLAVNSIFALLDRKSLIDPEAPGATLPAVKGSIEIRHVAFRYPLRPDISIFRDLNLVIPAGQTTALVGESGCGKSTVVSLIERFYDPERGTIKIDGVDTKTLQLRWLRQQMGLVSQEPVLFNTSIRDNILYGRENATEAEIEAAARDANAHTFVSALPDGYNTIVGERGIQLSGGQKQRIAIARAIVKDPRILLLDEATSALDSESEHVVQEALDRVMVSRTTLVIAHRLTTIQGADSIAVVRSGCIAEQGRHDELLAMPNGSYAALVRLHQSAD